MVDNNYNSHDDSHNNNNINNMVDYDHYHNDHNYNNNSTTRHHKNNTPTHYYHSASFPWTASATILGSSPTSVPNGGDPGPGFPKVAVIGVSVAGVVIIGFVSTILIMKKRGKRLNRHKALGQEDLFDHLPIRPTSPPVPLMMTTTAGYQPHQHRHGHDNHHHSYEENVQEHGGAHPHETEPMYHHSGNYHPMGHHDFHHHHDPGYHQDPTQGHAHQGGPDHQGFQDQGQAHQGSQGQGGQGQNQGLPDQGTAHHYQPGHHGLADQGGASQGHGFQDPHAQGLSQQGTAHQGGYHIPTQNVAAPGQAIPNQTPGVTGGHPFPPQNPLQTLGGGQAPPPTVPHAHGLPGANFNAPVGAPVPPLASRPVSTTRYSILMPASPTTTHYSVDGGLVDETEVPARGSATIGPLPLSNIDRVPSMASSRSSVGYYGGAGGAWDDGSNTSGYQHEFGYSPVMNKQPLLNHALYHDASSQQHTSGRVLPGGGVVSPKIATIPTITSPTVRAPQDDSEADRVGSMVSSGNVSSLNTFDRRHPQTHEGSDGSGSLFDPSLQPLVRNPQNQY
ncbi:hypothetical protein EDD11_006927 [Mortierella claussenii]|nr:hypothetical protein EDD11_006927 [Mortierella claussenii]